MFIKVESISFWYSRAKAITSSLDSFFSADSDNEIFIIEASLGYLLKSGISTTDYYQVRSLHLLTQKKIGLIKQASINSFGPF